MTFPRRQGRRRRARSSHTPPSAMKRRFGLDRGIQRFEVEELDETSAHHIKAVFDSLSDEDRYLRFLGPMPTLSPSTMRSLLAVDGIDQVAFGAFADTACIGIGRYAKVPGAESSAEVSLAVNPAFRRRGVAESLLRALANKATENRFTHFEMVAHSSNRAALEGARSVGFEMHRSDMIVEGRVSLTTLAFNLAKRHFIGSI